jgi:hypothetical protein
VRQLVLRRLAITFLALAVAGPVELLLAAPAFAADGEQASPDAEPSPTPTPEPAPSPTPSPTPTPEPTATPTPTPDPTPTPQASATPTPDGNPAPTPEPLPTPTPTPTSTPSFGSFTKPAAGTSTTGTAGLASVAWTETTTVTNRNLRQYYAGAVGGSCEGVTWIRAWTRVVSSGGAKVGKYVPGICYKHTIIATELGTGTVMRIESGVIRIPGRWYGAFDLYRSTAFSTQKRWYWCVPASVQMMLNLIKGQSDHSWGNQSKYYTYGRPRRARKFPSLGLDPQSWMLTLNRYGGSDYRVVTSSSLTTLLRYAAKRNRLTGKPVGLLVARGGHAWVMTGFQATADPALTSNYKLTAIKTMGPLWPMQKYRNRYFDSPPGAWFTMSKVPLLYGRYYDSDGKTPWTGKYVIISP